MLKNALKYIEMLPKLVAVFFYAYLNPDVSLYLKACAVAGIVYFFSPLDIIPDLFTGIGLLDDLIVSLMIMQLFIDSVPDEILVPIMKRLGTNREEMCFDVSAAVKEVSLTAKALWTAITIARDKIIEYYGRGGTFKSGINSESGEEKSLAAGDQKKSLQDNAE